MPTPSVPDTDLIAAVALRNKHPTLYDLNKIIFFAERMKGMVAKGQKV